MGTRGGLHARETGGTFLPSCYINIYKSIHICYEHVHGCARLRPREQVHACCSPFRLFRAFPAGGRALFVLVLRRTLFRFFNCFSVRRPWFVSRSGEFRRSRVGDGFVGTSWELGGSFGVSRIRELLDSNARKLGDSTNSQEVSFQLGSREGNPMTRGTLP